MTNSQRLMEIISKFAEENQVSVAFSVVDGSEVLCAVTDSYPLEAFPKFLKTLSKAQEIAEQRNKAKRPMKNHPSMKSLDDLLKMFETRYAEHEVDASDINDFHARVVTEAHNKNIPICFLAECLEDHNESTLHLCETVSDECLAVLAKRVEHEMMKRMEKANYKVGHSLEELMTMIFGNRKT